VYAPFFFEDYSNASVGRFKSSFIIEQIDHYFNGSDPGPIGVTTLAKLDDLDATSPFGRLFAEQMISELAMRGYDVIEIRHGDALQFLPIEGGEFSLSRRLNSVRPMRELGALLVGTYSDTPARVYVNVRLVDPSTSRILSAGSVEMRKTAELARLLRGGSGQRPTLERIPVRRLQYDTLPDIEDLPSVTDNEGKLP
jgi:TolB-like protein